MQVNNQETQGMSLFDFEEESDTEESESESERIEVLIFTSPHTSMSRRDTLEALADKYRQKLRMSDSDIAEALDEGRSVSTGGVRFARIPAGGKVFDELDRAGNEFVPTSEMRVWIPSLSLLGGNIEGIVENICRIYDYDFTEALIVVEPYIGIASSEVDLLRHLVDDVEFELAAKERQRAISTSQESYSGRPPVGYQVDETGQLVPSDDYQDVREVLRLVDSRELSKRQAAKRIDASPRTISRILDDRERRDMYQLDYPRA